ncbi:MAG: hypothetical protein LUE29_13910 [Lachnospiraceae bacterium]|nr:hypothetical protein [Lachnospiraceae bacterium]
MNKKFMSLVLTICLMAAMSLTVFADDVTTFGGSAVRDGDTITVTLTVDQAGATSGQIEIGYDEDCLTLVSASFGSALTAALADDDHADSINTAETGFVTAGFASLTAAEAGDVLIVVFTVETETTEGEYSFPYVVEEWSKATANDLLTDAQASTGAIVLAVDGSSELVDKTELQASADEAEGLTESDYTADSWATLEEALADAAAVLADENATQEEVDAANESLRAAIAALVKADAEQDTTAEPDDETTTTNDETTAADDETTASSDDTEETTVSSDNEDDTTAADSSGGSTLGTGDRNLTALWVIAFAALAGAAALVVAGKKKHA